jgi:hypothetical protein
MQVVSEYAAHRFTEAVNIWLNAGWVREGTVFITKDGYGDRYNQVMVKP